MNATFATVIHAAPKLEVDELLEVRKQLASLLEPEFVKECDTNYDLLNPVVRTLVYLFSLGRLPKILTSKTQKKVKSF